MLLSVGMGLALGDLSGSIRFLTIIQRETNSGDFALVLVSGAYLTLTYTYTSIPVCTYIPMRTPTKIN